MIELEYMPVVIEAHRNDLRKLYDPSHPVAPQRSTRRRLGTLIVRFGHWVENRCNEVASETPVATPGQQVRA